MTAARAAHRRAYVVALTGGVAAGKSLVAGHFETLGIRVYDADRAAREVVAPGAPALAEIAAAFGTELLGADGGLRRRALRERIFADPAARQRLEAILHPRITTWLRTHAQADPGPYCVVVVPLLAHHRVDYGWVDRILLVDAPEALQAQRVMQRDAVSRAAARRMLDAQATRAERLAIADDVISNDGDATALGAKVARLHQQYFAFAERHRAVD
ncbi:MAG TPA: dephospho-CoA kinase [Rhodanobacteraceae bacterium]|nr:dephospho-CoA kinase [Rhodanobacteraceae bacterium]